LARAQEIELQLGRDRAHEKRNGPRTADIDIIAYDDLVLHEPNLTLPHPRLFERGFVLIPLAEIAGDWVIGGRRVADAAKAVEAGGIHRLP
jgi:2-amino-4-hydroxy-6-hydroxymethyldihydropteridine diphosphokinase